MENTELMEELVIIDGHEFTPFDVNAIQEIKFEKGKEVPVNIKFTEEGIRKLNKLIAMLNSMENASIQITVD